MGGDSDTDGDGYPGSPPHSNRNPFSPAVVGGGLKGATLRRGGHGDEVCLQAEGVLVWMGGVERVAGGAEKKRSYSFKH